MRDYYKDVLFGVSVGDALGVAVEFLDRKILAQDPVKEMQGYGSHKQPVGTWSDDSSLTFCLADALLYAYFIPKIAQNFHDWFNKNLWTAHGNVFDIGQATHTAINKYTKCFSISDYIKCGGTKVTDNGNGSLMRILPLVFEVQNNSFSEKIRKITEVSSLTHGHSTAINACIYYIEFALKLMNGRTKEEAFEDLIPYIKLIDNDKYEPFCRLKQYTFSQTLENEILSSGYVVHSLEASIWCLLNTDNYKDAVLKAVNLGGDTDTIGAITGGLAGLLYGYETIPEEWMNVIARKEDIEKLAGYLKLRYEK